MSQAHDSLSSIARLAVLFDVTNEEIRLSRHLSTHHDVDSRVARLRPNLNRLQGERRDLTEQCFQFLGRMTPDSVY
jgi:hypothetical protein